MKYRCQHFKALCLGVTWFLARTTWSFPVFASQIRPNDPLEKPTLSFLTAPCTSYGINSRTTSNTCLFAEDMTIQRGCQFFCLSYDYVVKPTEPEAKATSTSSTPVVVLHGGPGVPSNYCRPLEHEDITGTRNVLFYDQLGCGKSEQPDDESLYSIDLFVDDLVQLLDEVVFPEGQEFHLYGQSFGGILAFEYLKRERPINCRSVILSSTPTNVEQVEAEADRLIQNLLKEGISEKDVGTAFGRRHQIQTEKKPEPLVDAYEMAGTVYRGTEAIANYAASLGENENDGDPIETPALILRGEYDFVTPPCIEGWKSLFTNSHFHELKGCAHHGLLERPDLYGKQLNAFWEKWDPQSDN